MANTEKALFDFMDTGGFASRPYETEKHKSPRGRYSQSDKPNSKKGLFDFMDTGGFASRPYE